MSGWRHEVFGKDAVALKHGELALTAGKTRIELVPFPSAPRHNPGWHPAYAASEAG